MLKKLLSLDMAVPERGRMYRVGGAGGQRSGLDRTKALGLLVNFSFLPPNSQIAEEVAGDKAARCWRLCSERCLLNKMQMRDCYRGGE